MRLIDGNATAQQVLAEVKARVDKLAPLVPHVAFVRVGDDPASVSYVTKKQKTAAEVGMRASLQLFPETVTKEALFAHLDQLNADPSVHGILIQAPLPKHLPETEVFNRVSPDKDVDGFGTQSIGRLVQELPGAFAACTPAGVIELLRRSGVETAGKHAVVVGRSLIVGKPAAVLLLAKGCDCTVTIAHSRTKDLAAIVRQADIVVAAIGKPRFITSDMVKPGAVVIDVGINRVPDATKKTGYRIVGDVDFDAVSPLCAAITPVPGGVGPMTVAMLMKNTLDACERAQARG
ncbi:MAG: bifunctional 5,10-methylene-tetrahydrofolate dehydrogenase/5,10-methylene-tetrahydrofolate cyclohydrolase [Opitutia bacterium AMD-G3]|jgi:methylenetetrahydrofolate dehydrogenase (NADP+)/methenyltetrahydrofolate cyclohydrolase|nr:MAG: bifunctional 5,10-methylene-tetrahydrofolate dehydrogenase/5,10-methylene-tetrahydrofolate cyclohydrolase [Opitutae bacterium AMD-G3]